LHSHRGGARDRTTRPARLCLAIEGFIDAVSGFALDGMHDERNGERTIFVRQWRKDQVDMVRHYNRCVHDASSVVNVNAGLYY
jgi:hypothetical protein